MDPSAKEMGYVEMGSMAEGLRRHSSGRRRSTVDPQENASRDLSSAQDEVFTYGLTTFLVGNVIFGAARLAAVSFGPIYLQWAILQSVGGSIMLAFAELDVNSFVIRNPNRAVAFAIMWIWFNALFAMALPHPSSYVNFLPIMPILLYTFAKVWRSREFAFTHLIIVCLATQLLAQGIGSVVVDQVLTPHIMWPYHLLGVVYCLSAVAVVFIPRIIHPKSEPADLRSSHIALTGFAIYLFLLGACVLLEQVLDKVCDVKIYKWPPIAWIFGPMHMILPPLMIYLRTNASGWLGRKLVQRRINYIQTQFTLVEKELGALGDVERTLKAGGRLNAIGELTSVGSDDFALLHYAAGNGFLDACHRLLAESTLEFNLRAGRCRMTPIHLAAQNGRLECVRCLIEHGADVNLADNQGFTPLYAASLSGRYECAELLEEHGAVVNDMLNQRDQLQGE
jgi:hypothetical protein